MGYFLTSEGENAPPLTVLARPKTHTPGARVSNLGQRSYSPNLGRWLSRDPIGERGGMDPYGYVGNAPIGSSDRLGLVSTSNLSGPDFQGDLCSGVAGYTLTITWAFDPGEKTPGGVIQGFKDDSVSIKNCLGNQLVAEEEAYQNTMGVYAKAFWESWYVAEGESDTWQMLISGVEKMDTEGVIVVSAHYTYYADLGAPAAGLTPHTPGDPWGTYGPGSYTAPGFWQTVAKKPRTLTYKWRCCCDKKSRTLVYSE